MPEPASPIRVLIACPGLGIAERGFERVASDWFRSLRDRPELEMRLVKGRGPAGDAELTVPTIARDARISKLVGRLLGRHEFWLEQVVFSASLQPVLTRLRPDVVLLSEWALAGALGRLRHLTRGRFKIVLCNGAPGDPPFPRGVDHVLQVTPVYLERALDRGEPEDRQTLLPHAFHIPSNWSPPSRAERAALRRRLRLPLDRPVLLTVGALNMWHKRMDYMIDEVASLGEGRPHLAMLGAREPETAAVLARAAERLGADGFSAETVAEHEVTDYYRAADVFALASGFEGFGLVLVEALAQGLPVLAQDSPSSRFVTGGHAYLADFTKPGELARLFGSLDEGDAIGQRGAKRHLYTYESFSWDALGPRYVEALERVAHG
ncbi:MAG: glycosyltransferase [Solirubrobacterales bacterium]